MAGVKLNVNSSAAIGLAIDQLSLDLKEVHKDIGEYLLRSVDDRFRKQQDPSGAPWAPLSSATLKRRQQQKIRSTKILHERGYLQGTITYKAEASSVEVGTNLIYGAIQQFGGRTTLNGRTIVIPARPYLGLSNADKEEINLLINEHIEGRLAAFQSGAA